MTPCIRLSPSPVLGAAVFPVSPQLHTDPRRVVYFALSSAFYLLLGVSDDLQSSYIWDQKLEAPTRSVIAFFLSCDLVTSYALFYIWVSFQQLSFARSMS